MKSNYMRIVNAVYSRGIYLPKDMGKCLDLVAVVAASNNLVFLTCENQVLSITDEEISVKDEDTTLEDFVATAMSTSVRREEHVEMIYRKDFDELLNVITLIRRNNPLLELKEYESSLVFSVEVVVVYAVTRDLAFVIAGNNVLAVNRDGIAIKPDNITITDFVTDTVMGGTNCGNSLST